MPVVPRWPASGVLRKCESVCVCVSHGVRNRFVRATAMPSLRGRALRERVVRGEGVRMRVCAITAFGGCVAFACPWKSAGNQLTKSAPRPCQSKKACTLAPYAVDARQLGCTPSALERSPTMRRRSRALLPVAQRLCPAQAPGRKLVRISGSQVNRYERTAAYHERCRSIVAELRRQRVPRAPMSSDELRAAGSTGSTDSARRPERGQGSSDGRTSGIKEPSELVRRVH